MLQFIGTGSAFNSKLGNNGAFIKSDDGKTLFMLDCGELTYGRLQEFGVLDGVEQVFVLMTHFHPDHVGSLGSLIFHMYWQEPFMDRTMVIVPESLDIYSVLDQVGVPRNNYDVLSILEGGTINHVDLDSLGYMNIIPTEVPHDINAKILKCFGYFITYENQAIWYSGDSTMIPASILTSLYSGDIDMLYQDTCTMDYPGNVHLSFKKLCELIPSEYRDKVWCMHLDKKFKRELAEAEGFNVVRVFNEV